VVLFGCLRVSAEGARASQLHCLTLTQRCALPGATHARAQAPLVYFYGHVSPDKQDELYKVRPVRYTTACCWQCSLALQTGAPCAIGGQQSPGGCLPFAKHQRPAYTPLPAPCARAHTHTHTHTHTCTHTHTLQHLVGCLASVLDSRAEASSEVAAAGMVVNTMGYIDGLGYELLLHAIHTLRVRRVCGVLCVWCVMCVYVCMCVVRCSVCSVRLALCVCACACVGVVFACVCVHTRLRACAPQGGGVSTPPA
jgi:hypothetical protein